MHRLDAAQQVGNLPKQRRRLSRDSSRKSAADAAPRQPIARLTGFCGRHRAAVVVVWIAAVLLGAAGAVRLPALLSSGFTLPGTDSSRVDAILDASYPASSSSPFVLVAEGTRALPVVRRAAGRAAAILPGARIDRIEKLPSGGAAAFVETSLSGSAQSARTSALREAVGPGVLVTGDGPVEHDVSSVLARDLQVGELYLAVPAALLILFAVFGTASALLPFLFAAATIPPALGLAWLAAHVLQLSDYLENMVLMIGLGIAIDYSLLVVNRYRDEREHGREHEDAVAETMRHAGRTMVFSGLAIGVGLALMLLMPVPFLRGFGVGGLLVPAVSIVCGLTLLPVLLLTLGERLERVRLLPRAVATRRRAGEFRLWAAHARWAMRRAKILVPLLATLLVLGALPLIWIHLGPGSSSSLPPNAQAARGLSILQRGSGADTLDPTTILVTGSTGALRDSSAAVRRLDRALRADPEVATVSAAVPARNGRDLKIEVVGRSDSASQQAQSFAGRLRNELIPDARFPASALVLAGGGAAYAADFVSRTLGLFPWLVLGVLGLTYLLLVRAFRSLFLPVKAIVLNMLTVAAASGLLIAVFQWGWGRWAGLTQVSQIEGWIPVFMFTLLFGLSMDYEVFLIARMRERWDRDRSNSGAVVHGLASTGRTVTAAGLIMAATFSGMVLGSIPTMQQLGFGLASAILIDITLVRGILLPSTMALAGSWNWYLPRWTARVMRV